MTQAGEKTMVGTEPVALQGTPPPTGPNPEEKHVNIRVSLFFDGTGNNRLNTRARLSNSAVYKKYGEDNNSYANDESNVSRLQEHVKEKSAGYKHHICLYVEGIGTRNHDSDVLRANALGQYGGAGVKDRVDKGIRMAVAAVVRALAKDEGAHIDRLTLDTFGFSRGAAAARYCVYRASNDEDGGWFGSDWFGLPTALGRLRHSVAKFDVNAVGLFDTVSSYGVDHTDDVAELKLDAIRVAEAVYHLAAGNEYRKNFSLTNVDSAGGKGEEFFLPGAHSDIGGGYVDNDKEDKTLDEGLATADVADFLVNGGWFTSRELAYTEIERVKSEGQEYYVGRKAWLRRNGISNRYSYIPLHMMADFATKRGLQIDGEFAGSFKLPSELEATQSQLKTYVQSSGSALDDWAGNDETARALRHRFLHVSFSGKIGMSVRTSQTADGRFIPEREVFRG